MLKSIATALCLMPGLASAQANCATDAQMKEILAGKYGESIAAQGLSLSGYIVQFWANTDTGTWTAVIVGPDGTACIADQGGRVEISKPGLAL